MDLKKIYTTLFLLMFGLSMSAQLTPWNAKLWVTHPVDTTLTDTIYVGVAEDATPFTKQEQMC